MSYKVAVCISGQLRTYTKCIQNIAHFFNSITYKGDKVKVDYFMHTWDSGNVFYSGPDKVSEDENGIMKCDVRSYKPSNLYLELLHNTLYLKDITLESSHSYRRYATTAGHWDSLFYSFKRSIDLKKQYEKHLNFKYDLVFKIRPDIVFHPECFNLNIQEIKQNQILTTWEPPKVLSELNMYNLDDIMFAGTSDTMDCISEIYESFILPELEINKYTKTPDHIFPKSVGPGVMLYEYCKKNDISPVLLDKGKFQYLIYRLQAFEKDLSPYIDIDEIFKIHESYYTIV